MIPDEVYDAPASVPLLNVPERQRRHFGPTKPAAEKRRQHCAIAETLVGSDVQRIQKRLGLLKREPISGANRLLKA